MPAREGQMGRHHNVDLSELLRLKRGLVENTVKPIIVSSSTFSFVP